MKPVAELTLSNNQEYYETSHKQRSEWRFAHSRKDEEFLFKMSLIEEVFDLDFKIFERAYEAILKKHESLRTNFVWIDGVLRLKVNEWNNQKYSIGYWDFQYEENDSKFYEMVQKESRRMPDYETESLISTHVFRMSADAYRIVIFIEHIIFDDMSLNLFSKELREFYKALVLGEEVSNSSVMQMKDYVNWKNKIVNMQANLDYWASKEIEYGYILTFDGFYKWYGGAPSIRIPEMKGKYIFCLGEELTMQISKDIVLYKTNMALYLIGMFVVLISRVFDQKKVMIQVFSMGRYSSDFDNLLANCTDFVFLFNNVDLSKSFESIIMDVTKNFYASLDQFFPYGNDNVSNIEKNSPFRINYFPKAGVEKMNDFPPVHQSMKSPGITSTSYLQFSEKENNIEISCTYSLFYYSKEMIESFFLDYVNLLKNANINQ